MSRPGELGAPIRSINPEAAAILEEEERLEREQALLAEDDDSDDSHESHSSHESYAERHGMKGVIPPAPILPPLLTTIGTLALLLLIQLLGLYAFTKGFLLTRIELEGVSVCDRAVHDSRTQDRLLQAAASDLRGAADVVRWEKVLDTRSECTLPSRYSKTLILIVDALRYDFIAPVEPAVVAAGLSDTRTQGVVTSIARALKQNPQGAFLSHSFADPPTTTLQRLKALTTGVLPTFIDMGSNFGGSEVGEDNLLTQLRRKLADGAGVAANGTEAVGMAFMGDDTWMGLFPSVFDQEWTWPSDSFVVEDLDTVDADVRTHLAEFMSPESLQERSGRLSKKDWRLIVAHNLGLDHAGHRYGPSHPELERKLRELDTQVQGIIDNLPQDALLIVLGDHGMDAHGDHGGDGELETGAGLFAYAKQGSLRARTLALDLEDLPAGSEPPYRPFSPLKNADGTEAVHRSITQIDLVPSLALLNGMPIPFNSLGTVIPELFPDDLLIRALRINALQIRRYLTAYAAKSPDFSRFQEELQAAWEDALRQDLALHAGTKSLADQALRRRVATAYYKYNRTALARAREVWARFDFLFMGLGICVMAASISLGIGLYRKTPARDADAFASFSSSLRSSVRRMAMVGLVAGTSGAAGITIASRMDWIAHRNLRDVIIAGAAIAMICLGQAGSLLPTHEPKRNGRWDLALLGVFALAYGILPASNSFLLTEDRATLCLLQAALLVRGMSGLRARSELVKVKAVLCTALAMMLVRSMSTIRICREEPGPPCTSTFYQSLTAPEIGDSHGPIAGAASSTTSLARALAAYGLSWTLPSVVQLFLQKTGSLVRLTNLLITWVIRPTAMMAAGYWLLDTVLMHESIHRHDARVIGLATWAKMALARVDICICICAAVVVWPASPLPLQLVTQDTASQAAQAADESGPKQRATLVGYRNVLGSSFTIFLLVIWSMLLLLNQPSGQLALGGSLLVVLLTQELAVVEAQVRAEQSSPDEGGMASSLERWATENARPLQVLTIALLGHLTFFATGHQAAIPTIQWRIAFVGFTKVVHPYSGILVALNSLGALTLWPALATVLLVLWQRPPRPRGAGEGAVPLYAHTLRAALVLLTWQAFSTTMIALFAAHFRRHLMLFKIWAPRYMLAASRA